MFYQKRCYTKYNSRVHFYNIKIYLYFRWEKNEYLPAKTCLYIKVLGTPEVGLIWCIMGDVPQLSILMPALRVQALASLEGKIGHFFLFLIFSLPQAVSMAPDYSWKTLLMTITHHIVHSLITQVPTFSSQPPTTRPLSYFSSFLHLLWDSQKPV